MWTLYQWGNRSFEFLLVSDANFNVCEKNSKIGSFRVFAMRGFYRVVLHDRRRKILQQPVTLKPWAWSATVKCANTPSRSRTRGYQVYSCRLKRPANATRFHEGLPVLLNPKTMGDLSNVKNLNLKHFCLGQARRCTFHSIFLVLLQWKICQTSESETP